jgi:hypothetical protein
VASGDVGHTLVVTVVARSAAESASASSVASAVVTPETPDAPRATSRPRVFGHPAVGQTLTSATGEWDPEDVELSARWQACDAQGTDCDDIPGATGETYAVGSGDAGTTLRLAVTATNAGGSATAVSAVTEVVTAPAIVNTAAPTLTRAAGPGGDVLTVHPGTWSGSAPISYRYQWRRCDASGHECVALESAGATYQVLSNDAGSTLRALVTASNAGGSAVAATATTSVVEAAAPDAVDSPSVSGDAAVGGLLVVEPGTWSGTAPLTTEYQWRRCDDQGSDCVDVPSATEPVLEPGPDELGSTLRVVVVARNPMGEDTSTSAATAIVTPAVAPDPPALAAGSAATLSGSTRVGSLLTVDEGTWDHTDPIEFSYEWQRCTLSDGECSTLAGATEAGYMLTGADAGAFIRVFVTATEGEDSGYAMATTAQSIRTASGPASTEAPSISGDALEGQPLSAAPGSWTVTSPVTYSYQWQGCDRGDDFLKCVDLDGATGPTYTPSADDVTTSIRVAVTATDAEGSTAAVSEASAPIGATRPYATESPTISGVARRGYVLTAAPGAWDGIATITHAFQWRSCDLDGENCTDIEDATEATYSLGDGDVGSTLRVAVTATNGVGSTTEASDPTAAIASSDAPEATSPPLVSGTARAGEELSATAGDWSGPGPIAYAYQWETCEADDAELCRAVDGATDSTYVPSSADVGSRLRVWVTATNATGAISAVSTATAPVTSADGPSSHAPRNQSLPTVSGTARQDETLTAAPGSWSAGAEVAYEYQWRRCDAAGKGCADVDGGFEPTYVLSSDDVGGTMRVVVTALDDHGTGRATSDATAVILTAAPVNLVLPAVSGSPIDGGTLTAEPGVWTTDASFAYQWQRCDGSGAACENLPAGTDAELTLASADVGSTHRVVVTATNEGGSAVATSGAGPVVEASAPVNDTAPQMSGPEAAGGTLDVDPGAWSGTPELAYAYQWRRCDWAGENCEGIVDATEASYTLTTDDVGSRIRADVTATNAAGSAVASVLSGEIGPPAPPQLYDAPLVYGEPNDGQVLTAYAGYWAGLEPIAYEYQWRSCDSEGAACEDIAGATGETYTLTAGDLGTTVRLRVTATNASGSEEAESEPTSVIVTAAPGLLGNPWLQDAPHPGVLVTADPGVWSGSAPLDYAYQWQLCDGPGEEGEGAGCEDIAGATDAGYAAGESQLGRFLRVGVTATNAHGAETAWSYPEPIEAELVLENTQPPAISGAPIRGRELTAETGEWSTEVDGYRYQWRRCDAQGADCTDIAGAESSSYTLQDGDVGMRLHVAVTAWTWQDEAGVTAVSEPTDAVATFGNVVPPTVEGDAVVGGEMWIFEGEWEGAFDWWETRWQRCDAAGQQCADIPDADGWWHAVTAEDVGSRLRAVVTAGTDEASATAMSEPSALVQPADAPENIVPPAINGPVQAGQWVDANPGEWDAGGNAQFDYQWQRCATSGADCDDIPGATDYSYRARRADAGSSLRLVVTVTNGWGSVSVESDLTDPVAAPEPFANLSPPTLDWWSWLYYGERYNGANPGQWQGDPDVARQWQRCDPLSADPETGELECVDIPGATDPDEAYRPVLEDIGYKLRIKETATTPEESLTVYSEPSFTDVGVGVSVRDPGYSGVTVVGESITALGTAESDAPVPTSLEYRFYRAGASGYDLVQNGANPVYTLTEDDLGARIYIEITASAWRLDHASVVYSRYESVTTSVVEPPPGNDVAPSIAGETVAGSTLEAEPGDWHGGTLEYGYEWLSCDADGEQCSAIPDATGSAYVLTAGDVGTTVRVRVTGSNGPVSGTATSDATALVAPADAPVNVSAPTVGGTPIERESLTADPGEWDGSEPLAYAYQWQFCDPDKESCDDIEGATTQSFVPTQAEVAGTLRVRVAATNAAGTAAAVSDPTELVERAPAPRNIEAPSLTVLGPATPASILMTDSGAWQHADPAELSFSWQRCDATGTGCEDIPDRDTGDDYEIVADDIGSRLRVEVTAETGSGEATAVSELSPTIGVSTGSAAGGLVFVDEYREGVYTATGDGTGATEIATCDSIAGGRNSEAHRPRISPSGKMVAVHCRLTTFGTSEDRVLLMNYDGTGLRDLGPGSSPAWTDDASELLISRPVLGAVDAPEHVYRVKLDGSDAESPEQVTNGSGERSPDLSPDGTMLAYSGLDPASGEWGISVADADGGHATRLHLPTVVVDAFDPQFAPDGNEILFTATEPPEPGFPPAPSRSLWAINADGSNARRITSAGDGSGPGNYDPEAGRIITTRQEGYWIDFGGGIGWYSGTPEAWSVKPDGSDGRPVITPRNPKGEQDVSAHVARRGPGGRIPYVVGESRGDRVHISSTPPPTLSAHGWWVVIRANRKPPKMKVTVKIQQHWGGWVTVATKTKEVKAGGGSANRVNARRRCHHYRGKNYTYRSVITAKEDSFWWVNLKVGKRITPMWDTNCSALGKERQR